DRKDLGRWGCGHGGEAGQLGPQLRAGRAGGRVLLEKGGDKGGEGTGPAGGSGWGVDHGGQGGDRGATVEGRLTLDGVEHGRAQGPEVDRRATLLPTGLLRRHIGGRSDDPPARGQRGGPPRRGEGA